jgi:hypothetical protein
MPPIRARTITGAEFSFSSREEFGQAIARGRVTVDWEVFHSRAHRWLPVTVHPAFSAPVAAVPAPRGRTSDLVLIYPDFIASPDTARATRPDTDPFDAGPLLAPDEIQRVLYAPRPCSPEPTAPLEEVVAAKQRVSGSHPVGPLLEKALPTFSKALIVAAELVQTHIA